MPLTPKQTEELRGIVEKRRAQLAAEREARIDRLAAHLRESLDLEQIRDWIVSPRQRAEQARSDGCLF